MENNEDFYTAEEASAKLGCTKKILEAKLRAGELVGSKRLGKWFILRSDLIAWIEGGRQPAKRKKKQARENNTTPKSD